MYKIKPYLLFDLEGGKGKALQNNTSTVVVTSPAMARFLEALETNRTLIDSEESLKDYFPNNTEQALQFLLSNGIIYEYQKPVFTFEDIHIISNSKVFSDVFGLFFSDIFEGIKFHNDFSYGDKIDFLDDDSLCIIFLNPFSLGKFEKLVDSVSVHNCIVKVAFYYNHSLYLSNYHKPSWKNPCPKCFFYSLEAQLRSENKIEGSYNFQTLVDILYLKEIKFDFACVLKPYHLLGMMNTMLYQLDNPNEINSFANSVHDFKPGTHLFNADYAYHWEMCDCYE
jgi:McbB family protein